MLVVKPIGRGRWRAVVIRIDDDSRASPLLIRPGHRFALGGITWRIVEVRPS